MAARALTLQISTQRLEPKVLHPVSSRGLPSSQLQPKCLPHELSRFPTYFGGAQHCCVPTCEELLAPEQRFLMPFLVLAAAPMGAHCYPAKHCGINQSLWPCKGRWKPGYPHSGHLKRGNPPPAVSATDPCSSTACSQLCKDALSCRAGES